MRLLQLQILPLVVSLSVTGVGTAAEARADGPNSRRLHNGIELPEVWPPKDLDVRVRAPMPVPYLERKPDLIPIDVGRQLFVDDFLIESTSLQRTYHQAVKFEGNPVVTATTEEELMRRGGREGEQEAVVYLGHGGVFYDHRDRLFKMWYTAGWRGGLAYATSKDLVDWHKGTSGLGGTNLILPPPIEPAPGLVLPSTLVTAGWDNSLWLDLLTDDDTERIKFLTERRSRTHTLHVSHDNRGFTPGISTAKAADFCSVFYNPFRQVWVFSIKRNGPHGRTRDYVESPRFLAPEIFDQSVVWVGADNLDEPDPQIGDASQLYSLNAVAYESIILGMFNIHLGPKNSICHFGRFPKLTELKVGFSRDGFHWHRPDRRAFIPATREYGDWDRSYLHSPTGVCLVVGDWLYFPYTGYSGVSPSGHRGMYTGASVGLARLRRDGFASMDASVDGGTLLTRPVVFSGTRLFANVSCAEGELRVEILDSDGVAIAPFTLENCVPIRTDQTKWKVEWTTTDDLTVLQGRPIRFRFSLTNGALYSFWVSPDDTGVSNGYLAAGGPGYGGVVDKIENL